MGHPPTNEDLAADAMHRHPGALRPPSPAEVAAVEGEAGIPAHSSRGLGLLAVAFALAALGLLYLFGDGRELWRAAAGVPPLRLLVPVGLTVLSYLLMALSYEGIAAAAGHPIGLGPMFRITVVSNTVNYLVATGGLSGFAFRMYFFRQHEIPVGTAVTISFVQGLLTNLVLLLFLVMGFYFLLTHGTLGTAALVSAAVLLSAFILLTGLCLLLLFRPRIRRRLLVGIVVAGHWLAHHALPAHRLPRRIRLWRVTHNVDNGLDFMMSRWRRMLAPAGWILLDWIATLGVLKASFWCVEQPIAFAEVAVGFAIGMLTSLVSLAPGGLGVLEGSMTTVFVTLGMPLEPAVVAVLIFRFAYYAVPFAVSLLFFRGMLRTAAAGPPPTPAPVRDGTLRKS